MILLFTYLFFLALQLDEDVRVLLQRFDAEGADELEQKSEPLLLSHDFESEFCRFEMKCF